MSPKDDGKATVQAELTITHADGRKQIVKTFDKAWDIGYNAPVPVNIKFNRWVRND